MILGCMGVIEGQRTKAVPISENMMDQDRLLSKDISFSIFTNDHQLAALLAVQVENDIAPTLNPLSLHTSRLLPLTVLPRVSIIQKMSHVPPPKALVLVEQSTSLISQADCDLTILPLLNIHALKINQSTNLTSKSLIQYQDQFANQAGFLTLP